MQARHAYLWIRKKEVSNMSLLILDNIVKEYKNQEVLNGVSLRVERGERLALVGSNGSGKSTLIKIAMGIEQCDIGKVIRAKNIKIAYLSQDMNEIENCEAINKNALYYEKVSILEQKLRQLEEEMAKYSQNSDNEKYEIALSKYSRVLSEYEAMDGYVIEAKIKKILLGLGLKKQVLSIPISKLSGGEKMRVALARTLLEEPDLLILDEPTNHLDINATEWLEDFLKKFSGGVLLVSHDRYFLDQVSNRIAELEDGTIVERRCNYTSFIEQKEIMREHFIKEQNNLRWHIRNENRIIQGLKSQRKIDAVKSREKKLNRLKDELDKHKSIKGTGHHYKNNGPRISFSKNVHISKEIAWAEALSKTFGENVIFEDASFNIKGGERIGIVGSNGCGKTTLINILLEKDTDYMGVAKLGGWVKYSYLGQNVAFQNEARTILEEIVSKKEMSEAEAREHLSSFQFYGDDVNKRISVLSGGERVRLYFACIMLEEPNCLIMDEPTNHLDLPAREAVESALRSFRGTVIAISHDRYFLNNCIDRILEISDKKTNSYDGNYEFYKRIKSDEVLKKNNSEKRYKSKIQSNKSNKSNRGTSDIIREADNKKHKESLLEIEQQILLLEKQKIELENSFDEATHYEKYNEYSVLNEKLNELYSLWEGMME